MVFPSLFSKSSSSPKKSSDRPPKGSHRVSPSASSGHSSRSPSKSPVKPTQRSEHSSSKRNLNRRQHSHRPDSDDIHPLNLPPDERERRLSAMSANGDHDSSMADPMDVDTDMHGVGPDPGTSTNGSTEHTNGDSTPTTATTPSKPPSPPPKPAFDPEDCKALGNKYFKAKDYTKAVAEYTKGMPLSLRPFMMCVWH